MPDQPQQPYLAYAVVALLGGGIGTGGQQFLGGNQVDLTPVITELQVIREAMKELDGIKIQLAGMRYQRARRSVNWWEDHMKVNDVRLADMSAESQRLYDSAKQEKAEARIDLKALGVTISEATEL